jgi:hypothetical protein
MLTGNSHSDSRYAEILRWINPPNYANILQEKLDLREEGTCSWITKTTAFQAWKEAEWDDSHIVESKNFNARVLWIRGMIYTYLRPFP